MRYLYNPLRELWERNGPLPHSAASLGERAAALCVSMGSWQALGMRLSSNGFYIDREEGNTVMLGESRDVFKAIYVLQSEKCPCCRFVRLRALRGLPHWVGKIISGSHSSRSGLYKYRTSGALWGGSEGRRLTQRVVEIASITPDKPFRYE